MAATPSGASAARVHFLSADSGLGKTTALADFARRASAAGQPVGGLLCPVGADWLRKMLSLSTGEQRALQVVPMTEADAATRSERLETTDARTRGTDSVSVTFISVAASASAAVSQSLCVVSVTFISFAAAACVAIAVSQSLRVAHALDGAGTMQSPAAEAIAAEQGGHGIAVGPFVFDKRVFEWGQATELSSASAAAKSPRWVIIDEVGPLELRRKQGLEPALSDFLGPAGVLSTAPSVDVIVVVRPSLRDQIAGYFGLPEEACGDIQWVLKGGFIDPGSLTLQHSCCGAPCTDFSSEEDWAAAVAAHSWGIQPQPTGTPLPAWTPPQLPSHPEGGLGGRAVTLVKLEMARHAYALWSAFMTPPTVGGCPKHEDASAFQQSILDQIWTYSLHSIML